nr:hypothetical protein [Tanacetum cinerariifolium]
MQTSSLKPYVLNVILEKIISDLEDEVVNLLEKEKVNLETIESLKSKSFESSEKVSSKSENQTENDCLVVEKECDKKENSKVIALGMFKLNVSQYVSPISMSKSSCDYKNVEIKLKRKRCKRKSSKQNVKQVDNDVSYANSDFVHFLDLDTFSSVRRPKHSSVVWKKKGSSNTSNIELKQYATMMRQNKNLMDINIVALYNILKQNQGDVNDAMGSKKKTVVVTSDPLALIAEKTNVSKSKEKVVVSSDSKGSEADDFSELKKITALL